MEGAVWAMANGRDFLLLLLLLLLTNHLKAMEMEVAKEWAVHIRVNIRLLMKNTVFDVHKSRGIIYCFFSLDYFDVKNKNVVSYTK
jgi:hypothetical protein